MKNLFCVRLASILLTGGLLLSCSKKDSDSDAAAPAAADGDDTDESTAEVNALSVAYPGTLALSMFPTSTSSLRLADEEVPYQEKIDEADKRLRGEGDCFDPSQIGERNAANSAVTCYEFDSDMNPSRFSGSNRDFGTVDGTDGAGQACMVTFAKDQVEDVTAKVDRALAIVQGLLCVAKKDAEAKGTEVEAVVPDEPAVELAAIVNEGLPSDSPISFNQADMSAVTNDDGSITYITEISIENPFGKNDVIKLVHTPATGDIDENGILSFVREPLGAAAPNYNPNDVNVDHLKNDIMSISYKKTTDDDGTAHMIAELQQARINSNFEALDDAGIVNFAGVPAAAANSDIHGIKYVSFDINPANGAGSLSYWMNPGGNQAESARGFLFSIEADSSTGLLSGCGISGATSDVSIRAVAVDSDLTLSPTRYFHPRENQNTHPDKDARYSANEGNFVTEQCFSQDATSGLYTIDTSKTESAQGYDVIAGSDSSVRAPARPPERAPPPPPPPALR